MKLTLSPFLMLLLSSIFIFKLHAIDVKDLRKIYLESILNFQKSYKNQRHTYTGTCSGLTKIDGDGNYILGVSSQAKIIISKAHTPEKTFKALQQMSKSSASTAAISFSAIMTEERGGIFYFTDASEIKLSKVKMGKDSKSSNNNKSKKKSKGKKKKKK